MKSNVIDRKSREHLSRKEFLKFGIGAGVSAGLAIGAGCSKRAEKDRPNIVLSVLDTTRADRLPCFGFDRPMTYIGPTGN